MGEDIPGPDGVTCRWCGEEHGPRCPWVKALNFDFTGQIIRVEFLTPSDWPASAKAQAELDSEPDYPRKGPR